MATKTTKKEELKEEKNEELEEKTQEQETEDQTEEKDSSTQKTEPEKESLWDKTKKLGGKIGRGVKKALPYVGAFAAGAGAAVGTLIVLTRPDGTEVDLLPKDEDLVPADDFIDGEATVVDESSDEG